MLLTCSSLAHPSSLPSTMIERQKGKRATEFWKQSHEAQCDKDLLDQLHFVYK